MTVLQFQTKERRDARHFILRHPCSNFLVVWAKASDVCQPLKAIESLQSVVVKKCGSLASDSPALVRMVECFMSQQGRNEVEGVIKDAVPRHGASDMNRASRFATNSLKSSTKAGQAWCNTGHFHTGAMRQR